MQTTQNNGFKSGDKPLPRPAMCGGPGRSSSPARSDASPTAGDAELRSDDVQRSSPAVFVDEYGIDAKASGAAGMLCALVFGFGVVLIAYLGVRGLWLVAMYLIGGA